MATGAPPVIDPNQPIFAIRIRPVTAPSPVVGLVCQFSNHGIAVHIFQLLHLFPLTPHIEIIKPPLPNTARRRWVPHVSRSLRDMGILSITCRTNPNLNRVLALRRFRRVGTGLPTANGFARRDSEGAG